MASSPKVVSDVERLASLPDEGNGEKLQGPEIKEQKLVKTKANKKPKAPKAEAKKKAAPKASSVTKPGGKRSVKKPSKKSKKSTAKSSLNPNGRKFLGPNGSPRGIRQDGKPRVRPGKNKPKSPETLAFGKKMAAARKKKGLTQSALASKMGISQPGLANIERGVAGASDEMKGKFRKALGLAA